MTSQNANLSECFADYIGRSTDVVAHSPHAQNPNSPPGRSALYHITEHTPRQDGDHHTTIEDTIIGSSMETSPVGSVDTDEKENRSPIKSWGTKAIQIGPIKRVISAAVPAYVNSVAAGGDPHDQRRPWRPTLIRRGPLLGIFSMLLAVASLIASLGILAGSNGQPVASWSAPPAVSYFLVNVSRALTIGVLIHTKFLDLPSYFYSSSEPFNEICGFARCCDRVVAKGVRRLYTCQAALGLALRHNTPR